MFCNRSKQNYLKKKHTHTTTIQDSLHASQVIIVFFYFFIFINNPTFGKTNGFIFFFFNFNFGNIIKQNQLKKKHIHVGGCGNLPRQRMAVYHQKQGVHRF